MPIREAEGGAVQAIATPMGQVYDLAKTLLVGKSSLSDAKAVADLGITRFADATQRVVFFYSDTGDDLIAAGSGWDRIDAGAGRIATASRSAAGPGAT